MTRKLWILKGCTRVGADGNRCHGDLYITPDEWGERITCLQCGYTPYELSIKIGDREKIQENALR